MSSKSFDMSVIRNINYQLRRMYNNLTDKPLDFLLQGFYTELLDMGNPF